MLALKILRWTPEKTRKRIERMMRKLRDLCSQALAQVEDREDRALKKKEKIPRGGGGFAK